jgi:glycogen(starch) synthase
MHVCLSAREYVPHIDVGGIGAYTQHLALGLRQLGHHVTILSESLRPRPGNSKASPASLQQTASRVFARARQATWLNRWPASQVIGVLWYSLSLARAVRRLASEEQVEILEVPDWRAEGLVASLWKPIPLVVKLHMPSFILDQFDGSSSSLHRRVTRLVEKKAILNADLITSPSLSLARIVAQRYRIPLDRIHLVRNPIDVDLFSPAEEGESGPETVLYVGRLNRRKGSHVLAQAIPLVASHCPETVFLFVGPDMPTAQGSASCKQELLNMLALYVVEDRVHFLPPQDRNALVSIYRSSGICVVPSLYDNLPMTCLEAMACGKAVVASDAGGMSEIITSGLSGILVPPEQPEALAEALVGLLKDKQQRQELGQNARAYVEENLSCARIAEETVNLYQQVVELSR